ncbi:hypothetical protein [Catellatospora sp. NPDC049609]|uniref:hypothetical protein n=1 Tax=Catellatospora sp. NPDC049609 TaxID=3155505 RepID=UPI00342D40C0
MDIETALLDFLRTAPALDGFHFGTRRPPVLADRMPFVQLTRTGGVPSLPTWRNGPVIERFGMSALVWAGPDPIDARQACAAVLAQLYTLRSTVLDGITVVRTAPLSGVVPIPDPDAPEGVHRATGAVLITAR